MTDMNQLMRVQTNLEARLNELEKHLQEMENAITILKQTVNFLTFRK